MGRHLAGDADERDRIHQRVGQAGDRVGRAGAGGDEQHADLAGGARIALGRMGRAALLADQDVAHLVLPEQRVVDRQHGAAGIAENEFDALILQRLDDHFGAGHLLRHRSLSTSAAAPCRSAGNSGQQKRPARGLEHAPFRGRRVLDPSLLRRTSYDKHQAHFRLLQEKRRGRIQEREGSVKRGRVCAWTVFDEKELRGCPHPALRATFFRRRAKGSTPPLRAPFPPAGEGWGEGVSDRFRPVA